MDELSHLIPAVIVASCLSFNIVHMVMEALDHMKFLESLSEALEAKDFRRAHRLACDESERLINLRGFMIAAGLLLALQLAFMLPLVILGLLPKIFLYTLVSAPSAAAVVALRRLATNLAKKKVGKAYRRSSSNR